VLLAACGGVGTYNDAVGASFPPGTEAPFAGAARVPALAGPTAGGGSGGGGGRLSAFCQDVEQLRQLVPTLLVPDQRAAALNQGRALMSRLPADAPADIRPEAAALGQSLTRIVADLATGTPNGADLATAFLTFQQSLSQVVQYATAHC
jgi:hypothetical protein